MEQLPVPTERLKWPLINPAGMEIGKRQPPPDGRARKQQ